MKVSSLRHRKITLARVEICRRIYNRIHNIIEAEYELIYIKYYIHLRESDMIFIFIFIAHVSNAGSSSGMELYAFKKVLLQLTQSDCLRFATLTTDRHQAIRKYMSSNHESIDHQFDVWHFAKSIKNCFLPKQNM